MVKIMELKKYKENNYKRKSYVILVIGFLLLSISSYLFYKSYALYEEKKDFDVINGTVEDPGDIYFAYYIDGVISRNMPLQNTGYTLDEVKSNCNNGVLPTWDNAGWKFIGDYHNYSATTNTRTKCTLYFNRTAKTVKTALGNIEVNSYTPDFTKSACDDSSCESHEKGIFETTDNDGNPTYYYRGSVENNYVKFAGFYWRIIRINSNGSIRMIYDGTSAHANGESSTDRQYGLVPFNKNFKDKMYVGYMYTSGEVHGTGTSSTIKNNIDKFYTDKLSNYASKLDVNVGFCGDRTILSESDTEFLNTSIYNVMYNKPTLNCENDDYYTVINSNAGNKALTYPVATVNIYEAIYAGHAGTLTVGSLSFKKKIPSTYLTTGYDYWSMTSAGFYAPFVRNGKSSYAYGVNADGALEEHGVGGSTIYFKPVINLKSDVTFTGSGTMTDPYVIK